MTRETRVLIGDYTPSPKLSTDGDRWAVVTATKTGVKVALGTIADLKEPDMIEPVEPPKPEQPETFVRRIDVTTDGTTIRAVATVSGLWDWLVWIVANNAGRVHVVKVDDLTTTIHDIPPGDWRVTAAAVQTAALGGAAFTIAKPVEPPKPVLPWIDILVSVPTPGSHDSAAMLDRGRLQAIKDLGAMGVRFNLHYRRSWASVAEQVELYAEYFDVAHLLPIIDWSENGFTPDADADQDPVAAFAVECVKRFGFPLVELGNETGETAGYFRVAVPVAAALLRETSCLIGISADCADYLSGKRRPHIDVDGVNGLVNDDRERFRVVVHPYHNPGHNRLSMFDIQAMFEAPIIATEWGVKSHDADGLIVGLDALRRFDARFVGLYAHDDSEPDRMGLITHGNVRTATGEALAAYIAKMRKDHGRDAPPDPIVPPDPIQVKPVVPPAHAMSGDYLNGYRDFTADPGRALFLLPGFSRAERRNMLSIYSGKYPGGFVPFAPWGEYHGVNGYDYRGDPAGLIHVIEDCHDFGCKPVLFVFADNFGAKQWSLQECQRFINDYLPRVVPALGDDPFLCLSWEGEQSLDALAREREIDTDPWARWVILLSQIRGICSRGELGLHLPPNEWSPLIRHTGEKMYAGMRQIPVDPNAVLVRMRKAGATALLMQWAPEMSDDDIVMEGHISAAGPGAKPDGGIVARVVRASLKYYFFESRRTSESARRLSDRVKALNNPGVSGGANGWTR